jgi:hypothetical protein
MCYKCGKHRRTLDEVAYYAGLANDLVENMIGKEVILSTAEELLYRDVKKRLPYLSVNNGEGKIEMNRSIFKYVLGRYNDV